MVTNYFKKYAKKLQDNGYDVLPIGIRKKAIFDTDWQNKDYSTLIDNPPNRAKGVSLRTVCCPAIDADITDTEISNHMAEWLHTRGFNARRYGNAPKFMTLARWPGEPQTKRASATYGNNRIELLGKGQQIVLFNIHADTNKEYSWTEPLPALSLLPVLTDELVDEMFDEFERVASLKFEKVATRTKASDTQDIPVWADDKNAEIANNSEVPTDVLPYIKFERTPGRYELTECIWADEHSNNRRDGAFYVKPGIDGLPERYHCTHDCCKGRSMEEVNEHFADITWLQVPAVALENFSLFQNNAIQKKQDILSHTMFRSFESMLNTRTNPDWLIKGVIEKNTVSLLFGDFVAFKSFIALDMALHIASNNLSWRNRITHHGPVFFLAGEGHGGLDRRIQAWANHHEQTQADFHASTIPPNLSDPSAMKEMLDVIDKISEIKPHLIVIDTLASSSG